MCGTLQLQAGAIDSEEGVEEAFELIGEIPGKVERTE
jgi:hypothetical protein